MSTPAPGSLAADVRIRPVEWLWYPYVPLGKLTAVAGRMGQGKTLWTEWLAAAVTTAGYGINLPRPGGVVMLSAEDDDADTIVPRLIAAGADLERVWLIPGTTLDLDAITAACEHVDARLLTIDPFTSYVGSRNAYKAQDVRLVLAPIVALARERGLAAIAVQHLNRSDATDALDRISDSQGLPQVARSVLIWGPDPQDAAGDAGSRKVLVRPKNNLVSAGVSPAASFEIATAKVPGAGEQPRLVYRGESAARADDVVQTSEARTQIEEARVFLRDFLSDGPVEAKAGEAAATEAGIGPYALRKARERDVRSHRPGRNYGPYVWELLLTPTQTQQPQQPQQPRVDVVDVVDVDLDTEGKGAATSDDDPLDAELTRLAAKHGGEDRSPNTGGHQGILGPQP
jgi:putative DNA primase/helicase